MNPNLSTIMVAAAPARTSSFCAACESAFHREQRLAWQFDAWAVEYLRLFPEADRAAIASTRRASNRAKRSVSQQVKSLGGTVARIPVVNCEPGGGAALPRAARRLHAIYAANARHIVHLSRALDALPMSALNLRFAVQQVADAAQLRADTLRDLFLQGQRRARREVMSMAA